MKVFARVVLLAGCLVLQTVLGDTLGSGLVGYWTFDETSGGVLHGSSGHGENGTLQNFPGGNGNWTTGRLGGALQFGGPSSHEYVSVPNFTMPTASMTLTAWVWANSLPPWATIAANWNGAWGAFNYSTFGSDPNLSLYVADGGLPPNIVNIDYGVSTASLSLNQWHFVAVVANAATGNVTFMQDNAVAGLFHYGSQMFASSTQLNLGDDPSDTSPGQGNWDGKLDDLAIWTRPLSAQELSGIYNAGLAGHPLASLIPEPSVPALVVELATILALIRGAQNVRRESR